MHAVVNNWTMLSNPHVFVTSLSLPFFSDSQRFPFCKIDPEEVEYSDKKTV